MGQALQLNLKCLLEDRWRRRTLIRRLCPIRMPINRIQVPKKWSACLKVELAVASKLENKCRSKW